MTTDINPCCPTWGDDPHYLDEPCTGHGTWECETYDNGRHIGHTCRYRPDADSSIGEIDDDAAMAVAAGEDRDDYIQGVVLGLIDVFDPLCEHGIADITATVRRAYDEAASQYRPS